MLATDLHLYVPQPLVCQLLPRRSNCFTASC